MNILTKIYYLYLIFVFFKFGLVEARLRLKENFEFLTILYENCSDSFCLYLQSSDIFHLPPAKKYKLIPINYNMTSEIEFIENYTNKQNYIYFSRQPQELENILFHSNNFVAFSQEGGENFIFLELFAENNKKIRTNLTVLEFSLLKFEAFPRILASTTNDSVCGDGIRSGSEQCDDNNTVSGDGCSNICTIEPFYDCSQRNGTYCFDKRPPYCLLQVPENHFFMNIDVYLKFSKSMKAIDFKNASIANISVSGLDPTKDFEWVYNVSADNKTYHFNFEFKLSFQSRIITIAFLQPSLIQDQTNISITQISSSVKAEIVEFIYYTPDELYFFDILDKVLSYLMIVLLFAFFPLLVLDSLSIFWLYIEMLQVLNLILFINIDYPDNAVVFFRALLPANFIKYEYLDFFHLSTLGFRDIDTIPYAFHEEQFTTNFIYNSFFALFFFALVVIGYILIKFFNKILITRLSEKKVCSWFVNICTVLNDLMEYSALLRLSIITFIPLNLAAILQLTNLQFESTGNIINSILALSMVVFHVLFFLFMCWFLNTTTIDLEDPEIIEKYLPLFDLLKTKAFFKRNFQIFFMLRKFSWIIACIFMDAIPLDQIFLMIFWSLFITTFMFFKKPYQVDKINQLTLLTEFMILIILLLLGTLECLNNLEENFISIKGKLIFGWIILSIGLFLVLIKALSMIVEILINIKIVISNTKFFFKNINNKENNSMSAEADNLIEMRYSRDNDVEAIKEVDEEEEYDEEREKERENMRL